LFTHISGEADLFVYTYIGRGWSFWLHIYRTRLILLITQISGEAEAIERLILNSPAKYNMWKDSSLFSFTNHTSKVYHIMDVVINSQSQRSYRR